MKWRYRIAIALGVLVIVIVAGLAVLFQTQAGLRWAVGIAQSHSDGALSIGSVEGKLAGPITVKNLRLTLDGDVITIAQARLDWRPSALAAGKLWITHLQAGDIKIAVTPDSSESSTTLPDKLDLPMRIIVTAAELKALHISIGEDSLQLDRLALSLDAGNDRITLDKLEARGPQGALAGQLYLQPHGTWPIQAELAEILRLPDYPVTEGRTRLEGDLNGRFTLKQTLHAPFEASLNVTVEQLFGTPHIQGTLRTSELDPRRIDTDWPNLKAQIQLDFAGSRQAFHARGKLDVAGPYPGTVKLTLAGGLHADTLNLSQLTLDLNGPQTTADAADTATQPGRLSLHGTVGLNAPYNTALHLAWHSLRWPLSGAEPAFRSSAGDAQLAGTLDNWQLEAFTQLQPADLPPSRWALDAAGTQHAIHIKNLVGRWLEGRIVGQGRLALNAQQPFQFTLATYHLHSSAILADIPGQLGFVLDAHGKLDPLNARLDIKQLTGRIDEHSVSGQGQLTFTPGTLALHKLELAVGPNHFDAHGDWGQRIDLTWRLDAPKLAALGEDFAGHLNAHGSLSGNLDKPQLDARLEGGQLRLDDVEIDTVQVQAKLRLGVKPAASLALTLKGAQRRDLAIKTFSATLDGPADAQHFNVNVDSNVGQADLSGVGSFGTDGWQGELRDGRITPAGTPGFTLKAPAKIAIGAGRFSLGRGCWLGRDNAGLCLAAQSDARSWQADMTVEALPLSVADAWLEETHLNGQLNGTLKAHGGNGKLDILGMFHTGQGGIARDLGDQTARFAFHEAGLEVHIDNSTAVARLGILPAQGGVLDAHAKIPWRRHRNPTGTIRLIAHLPDLSGIEALSSALGQTAGRLDADFSISGSLDKPRFAGRIKLSDGAFSIPHFGTRIQRINLMLRGTGDGLFLSGNLADGSQGRLALTGQLDRTGQAWALNLGLKGKDFLVADRPEWRIKISPDLDITLKQRTLAINGSVAIPSADITPPHFAGAIAPSSDLVIVGTQQPQSKSPIALSAHLQLNLGDDVHFEGFGLNARIGGQLTLIEKPGELTTASGQLKIMDGVYKAYGQKLSIQEGILLFSGGPIDNPGLNIRATRRVATVTAGLQITGTLRSPRMSVFSNPPMSQSNALSYLLFGHGVQQNDGDENSMQEQAASALGIAGATYIAQSLGKQVGLDTVSVENASRYSTNSNQASLFIGKYLSPRLYVSYGIGLYEPINLLRIRYTLSRHWALEAESGTISGADILYNIAF